MWRIISPNREVTDFIFYFNAQAENAEALLANTKQILNQFLRKSRILFLYQCTFLLYGLKHAQILQRFNFKLSHNELLLVLSYFDQYVIFFLFYFLFTFNFDLSSFCKVFQ